jgi:predicted DNA-binding protein
MNGKTWSTRLDPDVEQKVKSLIQETKLKEAEVLRRLIVIGLKNVKEPSDLLKA